MLDKAVQSVAAGHGIRITPNLQRLARASLRLPPNYENFVSNDVRAYAIEAEGLHQCAGDAPACDLPALLVIALAHMEWDRSVRHPAGLNEILPLVISTDFEATMARLKRAHAVADTMSVRDQRICVFCAPTPNGFVHGQTARRGELVLKRCATVSSTPKERRTAPMGLHLRLTSRPRLDLCATRAAP